MLFPNDFVFSQNLLNTNPYWL